jgi:hypothetical protein
LFYAECSLVRGPAVFCGNMSSKIFTCFSLIIQREGQIVLASLRTPLFSFQFDSRDYWTTESVTVDFV